MNNNRTISLCIFICTVFAIMTVIISGSSLQNMWEIQRLADEKEQVVKGGWHKELINRGFARYDAKTGEWGMLTAKDVYAEELVRQNATKTTVDTMPKIMTPQIEFQYLTHDTVNPVPRQKLDTYSEPNSITPTPKKK